jgi:flavin reductase (DIM6/NTAB) family NADH-FMN oxidoreductase RutF
MMARPLRDPVAPESFRRALGRFATGVGLLTSLAADGRPYAVTVNAFSSVSLAPPMVLVCLDRRGRGHELVRGAGAFAVNVLGAHQQELAERFAGRHRTMADPFRGVRLRAGLLGVPVLEDVQSYVECRLVDVVAAGDHSVFLGEVVALGVGEGASPLLFFGGAYHRLGDETASRHPHEGRPAAEGAPGRRKRT